MHRIASRGFLASLAALGAAALALPASSQAGVEWIGPNLGNFKADVEQAYSQDDLFTLLLLGAAGISGQGTAMPVGGQITDVQVEGFADVRAGAPTSATDTTVHFQDLVPAGGSWMVNATSQSFAFPAMATLDTANEKTVTDFRPTNLCVRAGDLVALNTEGGFEPPPAFYPNGIPFRVFTSVARAQTGVFSAHNATGNGATVSFPSSAPGAIAPTSGQWSQTMLLMRVQLATGADATPLCPGGTQGVYTKPGGSGGSGGGSGGSGTKTGAPGTVPSQTDGVTAGGTTNVAVFCHNTSAACNVSVNLATPGSSGRAHLAAKAVKPVTVGSGHGSVAPQKTGKIKVKLTKNGFKAVKKSHRLKVRMTVSTTPGGPANTSTATITLKAPGH
jgi:hypothetical protein